MNLTRQRDAPPWRHAASGDMDTLVPAIATIGVIGAGQMGTGIAHVCALAGLMSCSSDMKTEAAGQGDGPDGPQHGPAGQSRHDRRRR